MLYRSNFLVALFSCACLLPANAQTLVTDITVPGTPYGIAVNPTSNRIYVAIPSTSTGPAVSVIDGSTNTVIDNISTPQGASQIAVNIATGRVYVAGCNNTGQACSITVINGTTDQVILNIPVNGSGGIGVQGIAVNPVTNKIFVSDDENYELEVIDGVTSNSTYVNTGKAEMLGLAVDFGTNQILGAPSGGALDIFNGSTYAETQVRVGTINQDVAVNSFTSIAYVTDNEGGTLGVVNLRNLKVSNIEVGSSPFGVCVDYLSNLIFVAVEGNGTVVAIDGATNRMIGSVNAPSNNLDVNPATRTVYASSTVPGQNAVHVISE